MPQLRLPGSHRLWPSVPGEFTSRAVTRPQVLQPRSHKETGLGLDPFRSPLLRTSRLISLPPGTEMFQFPGFASHLRGMTAIPGGRVAPFGHLGITACVPLPRASRSLPRPSSPLCAQASPTCLPLLDHKMVQAEIRALLSQSTYYQSSSSHSWHATTITQGSVKIPFPTICRRPKRPCKRSTTHPLSFTFQTAIPRFQKLSR